ncbi:MAG: hypothetical protein IK061_10450, partial [Desulfovibrio sp.]|nr:hypothetical protein [Desulfovibrio sp.]
GLGWHGFLLGLQAEWTFPAGARSSLSYFGGPGKCLPAPAEKNCKITALDLAFKNFTILP